MARSKNQFLQNVHTREKYSLAKIAEAQLKDGEIAVFQNTDEPSLGIKVGDTYAQFKDSKAVTDEITSAITSAKTELSATIKENTTNIGKLDAKFNKYATSADTVFADTKTLNDAKSYTDLLKAKEGETYSGETLAGLKSEINSLKSGSETTVEGLTARVTQAENDIDAIETTVGKTDNEGLRKDVADLKTTVGNSTSELVKDVADLNTKIDAVSGASSAYTDSQINAIKGGETTETIVSLKSLIENNSSAISNIKDSKRLDSFKDVEDEINSKISSVYKVRGTKATYAELPIEENNVGDVYNVTAANGKTPAGTNYVCTATTGTLDEQWDALGGTVDLSTYATKTYVNDALTGVTGTGSTSIVTRLTTAETKITNLQQSASTLNTDVQTIKGWKINNKFISGSPILNGTDINVDDTPGAQTLKDAIAAAKTAGDNAMTYATGVSGSVKTLTDEVNSNKKTIDAYTVNGIKISEKPVLTGDNVKVSTATTAQTLNGAIADAKKAGTTASEAITTLRGGYDGTIKSINDSVTANTSDITKLKNDVTDISPKANSAVQTITVTNTGTNKITATKTGTNVTFNFDNMVIDCGEF